MTDPHGAFARRPQEQDAAEREARHQVLIDLLGAYADGELPAESRAQVEAHLVGCARCRRELDVHAVLRERLSREPVLPAPPALRDRILARTAALPAPVAPAAPAPRAWWTRRAAWIVLLAALLVGVPLLVARRASDDARSGAALVTLAAPDAVPLVAATLADYRRVTASELPGRARDLDAVRDAVGFPVEPLPSPAYRLLGAWTTTLLGESAAVLAYRSGDRLVVEYLVPEALFYRHPALREPASAGRTVGVRDGATGLVAWPTRRAGALLVGDDAPSRLAEVRAR